MLSFVYLGIYLLFWLSLIRFGTAWMGENHFAPAPVALHGVALLMCGIACYILSRALYVLVAILWLVPDRRIGKHLA